MDAVDRQRELKREDDSRAIRMHQFLSGEQGQEFMEDLAHYAGMNAPSHHVTDTSRDHGLIRDGMKTLYCKIKTAQKRGEHLTQ